MASLVKHFEIGQKCTLKELESGYQATPAPGDQEGYTVLEATSEYVLFEDAAAGIKRRIPMYLIKTAIPTPVPLPSAA